MKILLILSVFLPLCGFLFSSFLNAGNKNLYAPWICTTFLGISFLTAIIAIGLHGFSCNYYIHLLNWIKIESLRIQWGLLFDALSLNMLWMVTLISFLVHVYSFGYMSHDKNKGKFFSYLSLFTFFMLMLITAPNLLQLFFGWEGVGLASYLLIGFWYQKAAPPVAAMKAFIVNRIADLGLIAAIGLCFYVFETLDFSTIFSDLSKYSGHTLEVFFPISSFEIIGFALIVGAMGKSAQFGLHTWLPDAMEGPTPVSALIHAATMVTAGIFLICRFSHIFELTFYARTFLLCIGGVTALFAASVAIVQTDIKKIIAYSTCSQLGYMIMACGASAYNAAMFHLITHAFFKALLFLGAGSVIHAMSGEQNIQKMGGLYKMIPFTFYMMLIGNLAIAGIPIFAGAYSKDAILHSIYHATIPFSFEMFVVAMFVVGLTAFYSWRLFIVVFYHDFKNDDHVKAHVHEAPFSMRFPLIVLALGAVFSGILGQYFYLKEQFGFSWGNVLVGVDLKNMQHEFITTYLPVLIAVLGIACAYYFYMYHQHCVNKIKTTFLRLHEFLLNKWYFDEVYDYVFVKPITKIGTFFLLRIDRFIDDIGPDGIASHTSCLSDYVGGIATRKLYYVIALFAFVFILFLGGYLLLPILMHFLIKG